MKTRKWMALFAVCIMMLAIVTACSGSKKQAESSPASEPSATAPASSSSSQQPEADEDAQFPISKEPIKLKIFAGQTATTNPNWNDVKLFNEYEKMTNIDIDWQMVPWAALTEKRNLTLASGDYPDAFHTARLTSQDLTMYGAQGVFVPLNDLIEEHAPNFKKLLEQYPDVRKGLTMPDGNIYSFPTFYDPEFPSVVIGAKMWLKKTWLDQLGLAEPQTTEEFYNYLKAVKNTDLNGNGKADEIPYAGRGVGPLIDYLKGSWGLGNRGTTNPFIDLDPDTGKLRFMPIQPEFKEMLEYINKLYSEKLLNPDIFTVSSSEYYAQGSTGVFGSSIVTSMSTTMDQKDYVGSPALAGPHGDRIHSYTKSPLVHVGSFAITSKNPHPAETVEWIDYFYGDEGIKMFFMGFEGDTYQEAADGSVAYTDKILKDPDGSTFEQAVAKYLTWPGGSYPGVVSSKYFQGAESLPESIEATNKVVPYLPEEVWPVFNLTAEESEQMATLLGDIQAYEAEMEAKFIMGSAPFTEWDSYVEKYNKMGLEKFMGIYSAAYERYKQG